MFEAWVHGPVCPVMYQAYKNYGFGLIDYSLFPRALPWAIFAFGMVN